MEKINKSLVITTISNSDNQILESISLNCSENKVDLYIIGDKKTPTNFKLANAKYYSFDEQQEIDLEIIKLTPANHYSRKNIGYLLSMRNGNDVIIETDDDNLPLKNFWNLKSQTVSAFEAKSENSWINVYSHFTDHFIWPRGFPLEFIHNSKSNLTDMQQEFKAPIQQYLVNSNPDVDAIYRLVINKDIVFEKEVDVVLDENKWCAFNSQNTVWYKEAFPLMYLPATCNMRMTDIVRSYVCLRILNTCKWRMFFGSASAVQIRNEHNLLSDFNMETQLYLKSDLIMNSLGNLHLIDGEKNIFSNMILCYDLLANLGVVDTSEIDILKLWINDVAKISNQA